MPPVTERIKMKSITLIGCLKMSPISVLKPAAQVCPPKRRVWFWCMWLPPPFRLRLWGILLSCWVRFQSFFSLLEWRKHGKRTEHHGLWEVAQEIMNKHPFEAVLEVILHFTFPGAMVKGWNHGALPSEIIRRAHGFLFLMESEGASCKNTDQWSNRWWLMPSLNLYHVYQAKRKYRIIR